MEEDVFHSIELYQ